MRTLFSLFAVLGAIAVQGQVTSTNSSERIIVAAVFNNSLCQTDQFEIQQFASGQCSQLGSESVWFACNETDPLSPFIIMRTFSSAAECSSAVSGGLAASDVEATSFDDCSPVGANFALNFIACTDSAHLDKSLKPSTALAVPAVDPALTFLYRGWNGLNCEGEPDLNSELWTLTDCTDYPDYYGPSAAFCTERGIMWPSYSDSQCSQVNASLPFTFEPTGICFSAGAYSYMYGPCQSNYTYTGIDSLPPARDISAVVAELTPPTTPDKFGVAAASDPTQAVNVQRFVDLQCGTKNTTAVAVPELPLNSCAAVDSDSDHGIELRCTAAGVLVLTFPSANCTDHYRTSRIWRFDECIVSDVVGSAFAVSSCTPSARPISE